jgi:hypothetical protein
MTEKYQKFSLPSKHHVCIIYKFERGHSSNMSTPPYMQFRELSFICNMATCRMYLHNVAIYRFVNEILRTILVNMQYSRLLFLHEIWHNTFLCNIQNVYIRRNYAILRTIVFRHVMAYFSLYMRHVLLRYVLLSFVI